MNKALTCCRLGGSIGYVGVPARGHPRRHAALLPAERHARRPGPDAPLPARSHRLGADAPGPGEVLDLQIPLAEGYKVMDERRAIKALLLV